MFMKKKKKFSKEMWVFLAIAVMIPFFSLFMISVFSSKTSGKANPFLFPVILLFFVIVTIIRKKLEKKVMGVESKENGKHAKHFLEDLFSGMTSEENAFIHSCQKRQEDSAARIISANCPNCGAPIKIGDQVECEYCHSQIMNLNNFSANGNGRRTISPEEYNPIRYYEENDTGYHIRKP